MKRFFILMVAGVAALTLQSCKDETAEWTERIPIFKVSGPDGTTEDGRIELEGRAQTVDFTVLSTTAWSAEVTGCDAYSLNTTVGGSGKTVVSLNAPANESGAERTALVSFYMNDELQKVFEVQQYIQEPYIETSPAEVSVSPYGEEFTVEVLTNQTDWDYTMEVPAEWLTEVSRSASSVTFRVPENESGANRSAELVFTVNGKPELWSVLTVSQIKPAKAPTDLILDVLFNEAGAATDNSSMKMEVKNDRLDGDNKAKFVSQYNRYAASFNNGTIARSKLDAGYYYIPYTTDSDFAKKLADGYSYELVFCTYYDPLTYTNGTAQVKPFSSTQAGGVGVCLQANTGLIQFETHVGGGWKSPKSTVVPRANQYYHVVCTWNKTAGIAAIYVDGKLEGTVNTSGDLKFHDTSVNKRWFGIGADPSGSDQGEASFYGEVVIARLYDAPMSEAEAAALYYALK